MNSKLLNIINHKHGQCEIQSSQYNPHILEYPANTTGQHTFFIRGCFTIYQPIGKTLHSLYGFLFPSKVQGVYHE